MAELVRFEVSPGRDVLVEADATDEGLIPVGTGDDGIARAVARFSDHLDSIRDAVAQALFTLKDGLKPDEIRVSFGIRLAAEAGAVIAKTSGEGHLDVEMTWQSAEAT